MEIDPALISNFIAKNNSNNSKINFKSEKYTYSQPFCTLNFCILKNNSILKNFHPNDQNIHDQNVSLLLHESLRKRNGSVYERRFHVNMFCYIKP